MDEQEKASRGSDPEVESLLQAYQDALQQGDAASDVTAAEAACQESRAVRAAIQQL
jgi:hypothetical protein